MKLTLRIPRLVCSVSVAVADSVSVVVAGGRHGDGATSDAGRRDADTFSVDTTGLVVSEVTTTLIVSVAVNLPLLTASWNVSVIDGAPAASVGALNVGDCGGRVGDRHGRPGRLGPRERQRRRDRAASGSDPSWRCRSA